MKRAELGIDGNCGFARIGENLQVGESEFEEIVTDAPLGSSAYDSAALKAISVAYARLKQRFPGINYYIGPSHPRHC